MMFACRGLSQHFNRFDRGRGQREPGFSRSGGGLLGKTALALVATLPLYTDHKPRTRTPRYTLDSESLRW